jgi:putative membrane protein
VPPPEQGQPDPRVLQANERTFLAWVRTSLAIGAAGLGIAGLAPVTDPEWVRPVVAITVTGFALVLLLWAVRRTRASDAALRRGEPIPPLSHPEWVALGLATVLVLSVVALLLTT